MRDMTIGRYYSSESFIHSLDPRVKLLGALIFIISLFFFQSSFTYLFCLMIVLILLRLSKVPFFYLFKGLQGVILLLLFTFIFRSFLTEGEPFWNLWVFSLSWKGIYKAIRLTSRISLMILGASLLSYTTTPKEMADGFEHAIQFLRRFRFPVEDIVLTMTIAFHFIPIFHEEAQILIDAQTSRGVDFSKGGPILKIKRIFALLIPLFVSVIHHSSNLAMAMESRGYSGNNVSTKMYPLSYDSSDKKALAVTLIYIPAIVWIDVCIKFFLK